MILTRNFEEETSRSLLKSAAKGLTPFAVPALTDKQVDSINEHADAIEAATQTTVKDVASKFFKAEDLKSFSELVKLIRRYTNLIYTLFGSGLPLYIELTSLLSAFDDYGNEAIRTMSRRTMVTIVWLIHLQSRHFAAGKMGDDENAVLSAFSIMCVNVQSKQPVVYGNVPYELYTDPTQVPTFNPSGSGK